MSDKREIDEVTGAETTGHVWDGDIKELNKPLPKWWLYTLYASILWAIGYWILYPAWPTPDGYTQGLLGYTERQAVAESIASARQRQSKYVDEIRATPLDQIRKKPEIFEFALAGGRAAFGDNCAPCHGSGAQGAKGYPNLNDDDWIWGGTLAEIEKTITAGIRLGSARSRESAMPRFGIDKMLEPGQINDVAEYVMSIAGIAHDKAAAQRGQPIYAEQCAACHQDNGAGNKELGAPNLSDRIWLYGGSKQDIVESIRTGRGGVMPAFGDRLDPATIKMLALYVQSLGGAR
jgi:cytochrome c oxidase cbb3-type subunit III